MVINFVFLCVLEINLEDPYMAEKYLNLVKTDFQKYYFVVKIVIHLLLLKGIKPLS